MKTSKFLSISKFLLALRFWRLQMMLAKNHQSEVDIVETERGDVQQWWGKLNRILHSAHLKKKKVLTISKLIFYLPSHWFEIIRNQRLS